MRGGIGIEMMPVWCIHHELAGKYIRRILKPRTVAFYARLRLANKIPGGLAEVSARLRIASAERFVNAFDYKEVIEKVRIDVSRAHFWDITAVSALDKVVIKFRREATEVEVIGLDEASATLVDKFAVHDKDGAEDMLTGH